MLRDFRGPDDAGVLLGLDAPDDAAVYAWDGEAVVSTVDFFTPIVDDPKTFGAIAAANALSDIYAMGADPLFALNIVAFPVEDLDLSILADILAGGREKAREAGVPVIGGHSIDDKEPKYGMVVVGRGSPERLYRKANGRAGDRLVLSKALGTGIISTAIKRGSAPALAVDAAIASMLRLNRDALTELRSVNVGAVTDVTGYGLLGHLTDLARQSGLAAVVHAESVPLLPMTRELAEGGFVPGGTRRNLEHVEPRTVFDSRLDETDRIILADAQTSGGLLVSVAPDEAAGLVETLRASGHAASSIGELTKGESGKVTVK